MKKLLLIVGLLIALLNTGCVNKVAQTAEELPKPTSAPLGFIVDLDTPPFVPGGRDTGWYLVWHQPGGKFEWDPSRLEIGRRDKEPEELVDCVNANLLDFLLQHKELIPEGWKGKYVYFFGTIYHHPRGELAVRCLYWDVDKLLWVSSCTLLYEGSGNGMLPTLRIVSRN